MKPFSVLSLCILPALSFATPIVKRQYANNDTDNQLMDGTPCRALTIIFARGTFEQGNVGTVAGPPFFQAVVGMTAADKVAVQGVDYPANVQGFDAGGDAAGSQTMAKLVAQAQSQCPNTKLSLSGYSQGAQLVHKAASMLTAGQTAFVNSVVNFGDPDNGTAVGSIPASKVLTICHAGDNICMGGDLILPAHLNYGNDANTAAAFVVKLAGL